MKWSVFSIFVVMCLATDAQHSTPLPRLVKNGAVTQLVVDGSPMILLAGELHNSSPSSPEDMRPIWDQLQAMKLNAVIGATSWELVEPEEGQFDFTAVDDQVTQARNHGMHLVLIWFGSFKNASYTYAPMWVKRDPQRFPLAQTQPKANGSTAPSKLRIANTLSVFGSASRKADAHAFAALMAHLRDKDPSHTVVMIQVENESGLRSDFSSRDYSPMAEAAYHAAVPSELMNWMKANRETMLPELRSIWVAAGDRSHGTWPEVFGDEPAGDEIFMAWYTAKYIGDVAEQGSSELKLPMYANAWLVQFPGQMPGAYPSGGPVSRMMDVWHLAAPQLALLAPDIYLGDFDGVCASYTREDNPLFIPEARASAVNLFVAVAKYGAIGYSPFGIDGPVQDELLSSAYAALEGVMGPLTAAQANGTIQLIPPAAGGDVDLNVGTYTAHIERGIYGAPTLPRKAVQSPAISQDIPPAPGEAASATIVKSLPATNTFLRPFEDARRGVGIILPDGTDSFYIVGSGLALTFGSQEAGKIARLGIVEEGSFVNGHWAPGRRLNGDETFGAYRIVLAPDAVRTVHVKLYGVRE